MLPISYGPMKHLTSCRGCGFGTVLVWSALKTDLIRLSSMTTGKQCLSVCCPVLTCCYATYLKYKHMLSLANFQMKVSTRIEFLECFMWGILFIYECTHTWRTSVRSETLKKMCLTYRIICAFSHMLIYGACTGTSPPSVGKTTPLQHCELCSVLTLCYLFPLAQPAFGVES